MRCTSYLGHPVRPTVQGYMSKRSKGSLIRPLLTYIETVHVNLLEYLIDIVLLVVCWRLRYTLSLRDLAEMFLERGFEFTHEAVRDWEARFALLLADQLRAKRRGQSWAVLVCG
jgi:hypothetical protein